MFNVVLLSSNVTLMVSAVNVMTAKATSLELMVLCGFSTWPSSLTTLQVQYFDYDKLCAIFGVYSRVNHLFAMHHLLTTTNAQAIILPFRQNQSAASQCGQLPFSRQRHHDTAAASSTGGSKEGGKAHHRRTGRQLGPIAFFYD